MNYEDLIRDKRVLIALPAALAAILIFAVLMSSRAPARFPSDSIITIEAGSGLMELSERLEERGVIRSALLFRTSAILMGGERGMQAGDYYLPKPENAVHLSWRVAKGDYQVGAARVTIPEGFNVEKIAALFDKEFPHFNREAFVAAAPEGYLFPDTYFVPRSATASTTIRLMGDNFIKKIYPLMPGVEDSGRTLEEVITMASIVENEAKTPEDRRIVSGILWKRLELGMPLQVDAAFAYVNGKTTAELTLDDLKITSPYNTYLYPGLPPTPISNPGLESIEAALEPEKTAYLYFLTGHDGKMYYARTHDEHVQNKQKYLTKR